MVGVVYSGADGTEDSRSSKIAFEGMLLRDEGKNVGLMKGAEVGRNVSVGVGVIVEIRNVCSADGAGVGEFVGTVVGVSMSGEVKAPSNTAVSMMVANSVCSCRYDRNLTLPPSPRLNPNVTILVT